MWSRRGDRYKFGTIVQNFKSGQVTLSVWGMFYARGRSNLVQLTGTLNQVNYKKILEKCVLPFMKTCHSGDWNFIVLHDGCSANMVSTYLKENCVDLIPGPAHSPLWIRLRMTVRLWNASCVHYIHIRVILMNYLSNSARYGTNYKILISILSLLQWSVDVLLLGIFRGVL